MKFARERHNLLHDSSRHTENPLTDGFTLR